MVESATLQISVLGLLPKDPQHAERSARTPQNCQTNGKAELPFQY
jgi:hypothetical protein